MGGGFPHPVGLEQTLAGLCLQDLIADSAVFPVVGVAYPM